MAATINVLGSIFNTTAGNKTVTATPTVGDLIVIIAVATGVTSTVADNGTGGTYTQVGTTRTGFSTTGNLQIFVRDNIIASAASTIYTATQTSSTGGGLVVLRVTGVTATGAAAVRSSGGQSTGTSGTTPAPVLNLTPLTTNAIITAVANASNSTTTLIERTGYTEDFDNGYNTPPTGLEVNHRVSGETSATLTQGGTSGSAFASQSIELIVNQPPTTALNTPTDTATGVSTTPTLNFTGTDANGDAVEYEVQVDTVNTFDSQGSGGVNTYYFDGHIGISDPTNNWTNDANAFDGSTGTDATTPASFGSTDLLYGKGTTAPGSGGIITQVRARFFQSTTQTGTTSTMRADIYSAALAQLLGSQTIVTTATPGYSNFVTLSTPSGGWSWSKLQNLETKVFESLGGTGGGTLGLYRIEIEVTSNDFPLLDKFSTTDAGFTAGHPFASGVAKDFTVQAGNTLTASTTYYWRVRAIDPSGSNTYGAWATTRSFTTASGGTATSTVQNIKTQAQAATSTVQNIRVAGKTTTNTIQDVKLAVKDTTNTIQNVRVAAKTTTSTVQDIRVAGRVPTSTIQDVKVASQSSTNTIQNIRVAGKTTTNTTQDIKTAAKAATSTTQDVKLSAKNTTSTVQDLKLSAKSSSATTHDIKLAAKSSTSTQQDIRVNAKSSSSTTQDVKVDAQTGSVATSTVQDVKLLAKSTSATIQDVKLAAKDTTSTVQNIKTAGQAASNTVQDIKLAAKSTSATVQDVRIAGKTTTNTSQNIRVTGSSSTSTTQDVKVVAIASGTNETATTQDIKVIGATQITYNPRFIFVDGKLAFQISGKFYTKL